jgi:hypothetical protein
MKFQDLVHKKHLPELPNIYLSQDIKSVLEL